MYVILWKRRRLYDECSEGKPRPASMEEKRWGLLRRWKSWNERICKEERKFRRFQTAFMSKVGRLVFERS